MSEYVIAALFMLLGGVTAYLVREKYVHPRKKSSSELYTQALRELLDGKPEAAFGKLRQVVATDANNLDAYLRLGQILRKHNQPERALRIHKDLTLRRALSKEDKTAILRQLLLDYLAMEDITTAEAAANELLSLDSNDRWAHARLLEIQEKSGKWTEAFETASAILRLDSNRSKKSLARYKSEMGKVQSLSRDFHKARVAFKEALSIDPTYVPAYLALGDSYYSEKRYEDAVTFWNKLIEAVPEQGHLALERLQKTLFELGRFGDIAEVCEKLLRHDPRNAGARKTLAEFHEKKGDIVTAVEMYESLVEDYPEDAIIIVELIRLYVEQGDKRKIEKLLRQIERHREAVAADNSGNKKNKTVSTVNA